MTTRSWSQVIAALLVALPAGAQRAPAEGCTVRADPSRRVELPDGRVVSVDVQSLARRGDTVMAVGRYAYVFAASSTPQSLPVMRDSIIGVLMVPRGKASLVPSPLRSRGVLFPKVAAGDDGFHAIFATSSDTSHLSIVQDSAVIWYAGFREGAWSTPQRVTGVSRVKLNQELTSGLFERNGVLSFAFTFADSLADSGGIVMLQRKNGIWSADTLRTQRKPMAVRMAGGSSDGPLKALAVLLDASSDTAQSQLLLATFAQDWRDARVIAAPSHSVQAPALGVLGNGYVASWTTWDFPDVGSSTIEWVRVSRDERVVKGRVIAWGEPAFQFEMIVMASTWPIWLFHGAPFGGSVAVASATDSIPMSLGSVTAPFENPRPVSIPIDATRLLSFTMKAGTSPDEPPGASYATVLEIRCPGSAQR